MATLALPYNPVKKVPLPKMYVPLTLPILIRLPPVILPVPVISPPDPVVKILPPLILLVTVRFDKVPTDVILGCAFV